MTIQKTILLIIISTIIAGCDIIDEIFDRGNETADVYNNISKIEVEYFIDNATYDHSVTTENNGEFTSIAGTSTYQNNIHHTNFNNPPVLGKRIRGEMKITFKEENGNRSVDVDIDQDIDWNWDDTDQDYWSGQSYDVVRNNITFNKSYFDDFDQNNVDEYYLGGSALTGIDITYNNHGIWGSWDYTWLTSFTCGNRAYIKVKVHYE